MLSARRKESRCNTVTQLISMHQYPEHRSQPGPHHKAHKSSWRRSTKSHRELSSLGEARHPDWGPSPRAPSGQADALWKPSANSKGVTSHNQTVPGQVLRSFSSPCDYEASNSTWAPKPKYNSLPSVSHMNARSQQSTTWSRSPQGNGRWNFTSQSRSPQGNDRWSFTSQSRSPQSNNRWNFTSQSRSPQSNNRWNFTSQPRYIYQPQEEASTLDEAGDQWARDLVSRSCNYAQTFIDTHCHLDFLFTRTGVSPNTSYKEFMGRNSFSYPENYEGCVAVFCNPKTFDINHPEDHILNTVAKEDGVWLAIGCHPKNATEFKDSHLEGLKKMLKHSKVVALGEIGLDYSGKFWQYAEVQKQVLITQLELATEMDLPLVIHCRDADDDCLEIMELHVPQDKKIHLHCFTRDPSTASRWINAFPNLLFGFTPVITYKSAREPSFSAAEVPLDRLLLETDAPYFVPGTVKNGKVKFSHPGFALFTAEKIAELRGISVDDVLTACRENTRFLYGI